MNIPDKLITFLKQKNRFVIASHIDPDGDTIGSAIALSMALESIGKEHVVYGRDAVPETYRFLPGHSRFTHSLPALEGFSLILLDCNEPKRAGIDSSGVPYSVVIDHHETLKEFGDIKWIEPLAAATGMMVYHLIRELGVKITKDMATNLYTAIAIDTGTFRYDNTTSDVLSVCVDLVNSGADPYSVSESIYNSWSDNRFKLLISVLNTLEISDGIAITHATREMFARTGTLPEDTENFSNLPRTMKSVKLSAFLRETEDGQWKASLRSKGELNAAKVADALGGGGHKNAAGFSMKADLKIVKEAILRVIREKNAARHSSGSHQPENKP